MTSTDETMIRDRFVFHFNCFRRILRSFVVVTSFAVTSRKFLDSKVAVSQKCSDPFGSTSPDQFWRSMVPCSRTPPIRCLFGIGRTPISEYFDVRLEASLASYQNQRQLPSIETSTLACQAANLASSNNAGAMRYTKLVLNAYCEVFDDTPSAASLMNGPI